MVKPPKPGNRPRVGKPPAGKAMVNLVESRLPPAALEALATNGRGRDRRFAAEVEAPAIDLKFRRRPDPVNGRSPDDLPHRGRCPKCGTFRPAVSIVLTAEGWMCDGCVTDLRRRGEFVEWDEG